MALFIAKFYNRTEPKILKSKNDHKEGVMLINTSRNVRKALIVLSVVLVFAVGFMFLGMYVDIQIISKYDYSPISFTFTFLLGGALFGFFVGVKNCKKP